jgi:hypothetical protein
MDRGTVWFICFFIALCATILIATWRVWVEPKERQE